MKKNLGSVRNLSAALAISLFCGAIGAAAALRAQNDRGQYVISAKAGGVNFTSGDVKVRRGGADKTESLRPGDGLESGDTVTTGERDGRVEVLLAPGSYLRVAENSEFRLTDSSLDRLRVELARGSAVVEAAGLDDALSFVTVSTAQAAITIDKRGLYRINALPNKTTEVFVRKGRALVGTALAPAGKIKVEGGKYVTLVDGQATLAKFDKKLDRDAFDRWSGERAETLAAASRNLSKRTLAGSYSSYRSSMWNRRYGLFNSYAGLWLYDPFFGAHTFLPFYSGLSSPYGHSYSHGFGLSHNHLTPIFAPHGHNRGVIGSTAHAGNGSGHSPGHLSGGTHGSDHFSSGAHSAATHHQSPAHISSPHHGRGH